MTSDAATATAEVRIERNEDESRYEIWLGDALAGFTEFHPDSEGRVVFPHTETDPAFKGQGLGRKLVTAALEDAATRGETVVPECPFVARTLKKDTVAGLSVAWPDGTTTEQ